MRPTIDSGATIENLHPTFPLKFRGRAADFADSNPRTDSLGESMFLDAATGRDAELLARFAASGDGAAFAELVRRHGPLARGVCERVLFDRAEADDAYQATLIVLARKAGQVRDPGRLGPWIYGVAVRCAMRARRSARLRRRRESPMREMPARAVDADWSDVRPLLDAEIAALPEKLRAAIVMCELQGVDRAEAARRLGVPEGTLSSRLARAKDALRVRLVRRGVALSAGGVAATLGRAQVSSAGVPAAGTPSAAAITLAELEVVMFPNLGIVKVALGLLTALGLTLAGIGLMPADKAKPDAVAAEKAKLKGEWQPVEVWDAGKRLDQFALGNAGRFYWWMIVPPRDINRQDPPGWGRSVINIDVTTSPKQFDTAPTDGPPDGPYNPGIYKLDGDTLTVRISDQNVPYGELATQRPSDFDPASTKSGGSLYILKRAVPGDAVAAKELEGSWEVESVSYDGDPTRGRQLFEPLLFNRRTFQMYSGRVQRPSCKLRYRVDSSQTPPRLDWSGTKPDNDGGIWPPIGPDAIVPGIYKLEGDTLTWHLAIRGNGEVSGVPTDFTPSKPGARHVLAVFKREPVYKPAQDAEVTPPATSTATDAFTGAVQVNGRDATSGRVAVYFDRGQFAGSLLVNGQFSIVGVPAGKHRVVVEGEVDGVRETTTASVEFNGAGMKRDFDLK